MIPASVGFMRCAQLLCVDILLGQDEQHAPWNTRTIARQRELSETCGLDARTRALRRCFRGVGDRKAAP